MLGSAGNNGGNYNAAISTEAVTTYVQNYVQRARNICRTCPSITPSQPTPTLPTYSFNYAPDIIVKVAIDPGWGHYEIIGIGRFAHETIYPGVTTDALKYGGQKDIETGAPVVASATTAGAFSNSIALGGVGGSFRVPLGKDGRALAPRPCTDRAWAATATPRSPT